MNKNVTWINCAKFVAILAVVLDHASLILYNSEKLKMTTFFSVTLFILLTGYTTYLSYQNIEPKDMTVKTIKKLIKIMISYLAAVFVYQIAAYDYFDLKQYFIHVVKFDLRGPFYFILIYIQYIIITPLLMVLIRFIKKQKLAVLWETLFLLPIAYISIYCIHNSYMAEVYGGGQFLLGGTFLLFFYLGILFAGNPIRIEKKIVKVICCIATTCVWVIIWQMFIRKGYFLDDYFLTYQKANPPGLTVGLYSLITFGMLSFIFNMIPQKNRLIKIIDYIGQSSLYVFLYHELFLIIMTKMMPLESYLLKWLIYFPVVMLVPVLIKYVIQKIKVTEGKIG